jgi:hypothetical protein
MGSSLTKKAEPPPTRDVNRDSGTDSANGGWLRRLVRRHGHINLLVKASQSVISQINPPIHQDTFEDTNLAQAASHNKPPTMKTIM